MSVTTDALSLDDPRWSSASTPIRVHMNWLDGRFVALNWDGSAVVGGVAEVCDSIRVARECGASSESSLPARIYERTTEHELREATLEVQEHDGQVLVVIVAEDARILGAGRFAS